MARRWTHDEAAAAMGLSRGQYIKLERGERGLTERTIARAQEAFGVSAEEVISNPRKLSKPVIASAALPGVRDLPVYTATPAGHGPDMAGEIIVRVDRPIEYVPRPWFLREVPDGWVLLMPSDEMEPAYDIGDSAIIDPRALVRPGKDAFFVHKDSTEYLPHVLFAKYGHWLAEDSPMVRGRVARLTGSDRAAWHVHQFNPPNGQKARFPLPRVAFPIALRIVGRYSGP
jgi:transcriptional regulator with XRE-family HTH domain